MRKAQSPSDADFIEVYQKAKYGINLIAKLGHHLSNPTAEMLLEGFFVYLREFIKKNKVYVISMQPSLLMESSYGSPSTPQATSCCLSTGTPAD